MIDIFIDNYYNIKVYLKYIFVKMIKTVDLQVLLPNPNYGKNIDNTSVMKY